MTVIDFTAARIARLTGQPVRAVPMILPFLQPEAPRLAPGDIVELADGRRGRIREIRGRFAMVAMFDELRGITRCAPLDSLTEPVAS
jgi:hypothetical protein